MFSFQAKRSYHYVVYYFSTSFALIITVQKAAIKVTLLKFFLIRRLRYAGRRSYKKHNNNCDKFERWDQWTSITKVDWLKLMFVGHRLMTTSMMVTGCYRPLSAKRVHRIHDLPNRAVAAVSNFSQQLKWWQLTMNCHLRPPDATPFSTWNLLGPRDTSDLTSVIVTFALRRHQSLDAAEICAQSDPSHSWGVKQLRWGPKFTLRDAAPLRHPNQKTFSYTQRAFDRI